MNNIKRARQIRGLKQKDLAHQLGITQGSLSNWERGVYSPDSLLVGKMARILDCTTDFLLGVSTSGNADAEHDLKISPGVKAETDMNDMPADLLVALYGEARELTHEQRAEVYRIVQEIRRREGKAQ